MAEVATILDIPEGYKPTEDEEYMNPQQLEYFRRKLLTWRESLLREFNDMLGHLKEEHVDHPGDDADRAFPDLTLTVEMKTEQRYRELLYQIDDALQRIQDGTYGYCDDTGNEIGVRRLEAWPIAILSLEAQKRRERLEKQQRGLA